MECSILTIVNNELRVLDVLPHKSIVWEEKWQDSGSFQAVFTRTPYVLDAVKAGNFVYLSGRQTAMYIHTVKITATEVWAYGYEAKQLLDKQALLPIENYNTAVNVKILINTIILFYILFPWFDAENSKPLIEEVGTTNIDAMEYLSVFQFLHEVGTAKRAGYNLVFNSSATKLLLTFHRGADRTENNGAGNSPVILSEYIGNIKGSAFTQSNKNFINRVIALGTNGITEAAGQPEQDEITYSAVLDLRDSFQWDSEEMTEAEYRAALYTRANMSLIARYSTEQIDAGQVDISGFESDYYLGDIVSIKLPDIGVSDEQRVVAAKWTIEGNKTTLALTFKEV